MKSFKKFISEAKYGHTLWIDPKGKVYDMNDRKEITSDSGHPYTHYDWVAANFTKYFGKDMPSNMGSVVYDAPMEKGWARIRNHRSALDVEVDMKHLSRAQKKVIRDIYDSGGDMGRLVYFDAYKKNKTSRKHDISLKDYDAVVDFLSEAEEPPLLLAPKFTDPQDPVYPQIPVLHPELLPKPIPDPWDGIEGQDPDDDLWPDPSEGWPPGTVYYPGFGWVMPWPGFDQPFIIPEDSDGLPDWGEGYEYEPPEYDPIPGDSYGQGLWYIDENGYPVFNIPGWGHWVPNPDGSGGYFYGIDGRSWEWINPPGTWQEIQPPQSSDDDPDWEMK